MLFGIELVRADGSRAVDEAERVLYASLEAGLSFKIGMGNVLSLYPPLIIDVREMQRALDILDDSIGLVSTRRGSS